MKKLSIADSSIETKIAFIVSSVGDTDLAKATIMRLLELGIKDPIFMIPVATAAANRLADLNSNPQIKITSLDKIIQQPDALTKKKISSAELQLVNKFILEKNIQRAFIGVTSAIDEEIPFQIAGSLAVPCTIAYEFMFKPAKHFFWNYVPELASKQNVVFAAPLKSSIPDFHDIDSNAIVKTIGHLCIDRAQNPAVCNKEAIKKSLLVDEKEDFTFISGTTQAIEVDTLFLDALLQELSTGKYPQFQIRFGLHPGIKDPDLYLQSLFSIYEKYSESSSQLKIVLTETMQKRLINPSLKEHCCILLGNISGSDMALAADRVAQSVPGALLNESALVGKPSYFHVKSSTPYLPERWFSGTISDFFQAKPDVTHNLAELELTETAPTAIAKLLLE
ncbi:MAG: hypothetical protein K2X50_04850 [Gammaproteobacteria bacterium]|nr:hypothetical protein [Gammaproteobacteria bacterium]